MSISLNYPLDSGLGVVIRPVKFHFRLSHGAMAGGAKSVLKLEQFAGINGPKPDLSNRSGFDLKTG